MKTVTKKKKKEIQNQIQNFLGAVPYLWLDKQSSDGQQTDGSRDQYMLQRSDSLV